MLKYLWFPRGISAKEWKVRGLIALAALVTWLVGLIVWDRHERRKDAAWQADLHAFTTEWRNINEGA